MKKLLTAKDAVNTEIMYYKYLQVNMLKENGIIDVKKAFSARQDIIATLFKVLLYSSGPISTPL